MMLFTLRHWLGLAPVVVAMTLFWTPLAMAKDSAYSRYTVVVYNKNFPGSDHVARHYLTVRSIPKSNLIALDCPIGEEITRAEYETTIARPLRKVFVEKEWWTVEKAGGVNRVVDNDIKVVALVHGMPLKIKDSREVPEGGSNQAWQTQSDGASVDSELCLLGTFATSFGSQTPNPYFRESEAFGDVSLPQMMMVGRIDGPTPELCRKMIDDATEVERNGLWGRAYVDLAQKTTNGFGVGENWLKNIVTQLNTDGICTTVDHNAATLPNFYPMDEAALYFGWYARNANGPFNNPNFQLKQGAIACHIHSYSAVTVRSSTAEWVGPLVRKGATGVLGNVYEPFLGGTTHLDVFLRRLLDGYTLAEAAYMATPVLSWMSVVVGDPLYRPYEGFRTYEPQFFRKDAELHYKTFHVATKLFAKDSAYEMKAKLDKATDNHKTGFYYEALALREREANSHNRALSLLEVAKKRYLRAKDKLRVDLARVDIERARHNKGQALAILREMRKDDTYRDEDGEKARVVTALLNQLDPPGPSGS